MVAKEVEKRFNGVFGRVKASVNIKFPEGIVAVEVIQPDHLIVGGGWAEASNEERKALRMVREMLWVQSLYILKSEREPVRRIAVISLLWMSS